MFARPPNASLYPEIDFASKVIPSITSTKVRSPYGTLSNMGALLYPLSNGQSSDVERRLQHSRFYVGAYSTDRAGLVTTEGRSKHVAIDLEDVRLEKLEKGADYI